MEKINNSAIIKSELTDMVLKIKSVCRDNQIPFFIAFLEKNDADKTTYFTQILSPKVLELSVTDDRISKMLNVMNGFETVPPTKPVEIDF